MRIVSLVPSLTETLIACQAEVVGRSHYCIHPAERVAAIPAIGRTKSIDWSEVASLAPDLIIMDKEENTLEMAQQCPYPYIALHITNLFEAATELERLAQRIENPLLSQLATRWHAVAQQPLSLTDLIQLPGMIDWWRPPSGQRQVEYLIWKKPYMAIGEGTFIHAMLCHLGLTDYLVPHEQKYPQVELASLDPAQTLLLFSTEPFPFQRYREQLLELGFCCGLIDGEQYSWYGVRSLEFLEQSLRDHDPAQ